MKESRVLLLPGLLYQIKEAKRNERRVYGDSTLAAWVLRGLIFTQISDHDEGYAVFFTQILHGRLSPFLTPT